MDNVKNFFEELYENFNHRKIDLVISHMSENVQWANGMDGGYVNGKDGVKDYWTRQFKMVSSNVTPVEIEQNDDRVSIKVDQVVHDLDGNLLADTYTNHYFRLQGNKISEFHIGQIANNN
jgi:predicted SnoaL-like aldol condensation-catalyzing enzyme